MRICCNQKHEYTFPILKRGKVHFIVKHPFSFRQLKRLLHKRGLCRKCDLTLPTITCKLLPLRVFTCVGSCAKKDVHHQKSNGKAPDPHFFHRLTFHTNPFSFW